MKIKIEIKHYWTGSVLFEYESEGNTLKETLLQAVKQSVDLSGADLRSVDLRSANLRSADLSGADLSGADLSGADLSGADLSGVDLSGADLSGVDLSGVDLRSADLSGADLRSADLTPIKADFFYRLLLQKNEVAALRQSVIHGKIDGSQYKGECCCFVGTVAKAADIYYKDLPNLKPDSNSPTERFFMGIKKGDTPENNQVSLIILAWIDEFLALIK